MPLSPSDDEVLEGLRAEGRAIESEIYPGDLAADIRARRGVSAWRRPTARWALITAAAALVALSPVLRDHPARAPARSGPSLFGTVRLAAGGALPLQLAPAPPRLGSALSAGAASLSRLRPPSTPGAQTKEEK